ncbi:MAG: TrbC/VirB2 family protein [Polaromonas sp.]|uniref:TrbC/VirB2 family protein n=1 Tax=Polaromonas sp. TaxID=1869339 RepID=UPI0024894568|nr:TrbC/VirB2 family protein [Polaromonas sp.]MDI1236354.1 TrbC/VirB2 family protein [Polaromonas sp.]
MFSTTVKPAHSIDQIIRIFIVLAVGFLLLSANDQAFAQTTSNFSLPGLDNVLCGIYTYLAKKILFYVALIVAIVGILAYLLKMDKGVWGTLFVIALLIGIAQGLGSVLSSLGSFDVQCAAIR